MVLLLLLFFNENYKEFCPWATVPELEPKETWPKEMTAAVVEAMNSKKVNRE